MLWYLDSGCSKHMTGNRSKLMNFVEKFIGSVRFGNDHLGAIMGYGDYVMGDNVISKVYYMEGLGHNLFSVGQFCDSDLEVAFRKHTCSLTLTKHDDEEKTAFHTSQGVYCYTKMPFGLKNAGATYQRLVDNAFEGQVGRNLEVYVDDLVIKSHTEDELVRDIVETFRALRKINMKLNPKKCTFGATEGMFLGYLIEPDGIKPCPEKTKAVIQLPSPRTTKEVQSLNGKLAGLNRFLSKSADKSLPLLLQEA
ncbi:reverse transcriptase domain-containing protein [Tanacetum coccineum]